MSHVCGPLPEALTTDITCVRLFARVNPDVLDQIEFKAEPFFTVLALKGLDTGMK